MSLPQELIDEILCYLPLDGEHGEQSLRNCSLVARSWINPSRKHLFETVEIRETTLRSWYDSVSPANGGLLQHVRSLSYLVRLWPVSPPPEYRIDALRDYLPSLHNLQHLSLSSFILLSDVSQQVGPFSAFRHTLVRLSLSQCKVTTSALVTLINYFPHLNRLDLSRIPHGAYDKPASPASRPLIRQLHIFELYRSSGFGLFHQLSAVGLAFDEIVFGEHPQIPPLTFERVVGAVGAGVKRLRLSKPLKRGNWVEEPAAPSRCQELREFEISVTHPGPEEVDLVSSISPTSIQKVTFVRQPVVRGFSRSDIGWEILDDPLCRLADRLGRERVLEVEFRLMGKGVMGAGERAGGLQIANSLTMFGEKGRMKVVWVGSDGNESVIYASDCVT